MNISATNSITLNPDHTIVFRGEVVGQWRYAGAIGSIAFDWNDPENPPQFRGVLLVGDFLGSMRPPKPTLTPHGSKVIITGS